MLPDQPGTYVLVLYLANGTTIQVGRLGSVNFPVGWFAYVGSGCGPGGLAARISRHLRSDKPRHWHIDYLRAFARPVSVWYATEVRGRECQWAEALSHLPGALLAAPGFGASDCRCAGHLIGFSALPTRKGFSQAVGGEVSCSGLGLSPCLAAGTSREVQPER
jgi:Uri superfamily endonuclease